MFRPLVLEANPRCVIGGTIGITMETERSLAEQETPNLEATMRILSITFGIALGMTALTGGGANAQNYPWCAQYGGKMGGSQNCGFSTFAQCQAALSGNGGFCNRNTQYTGGDGYQRRHYRYRQYD